MHQLQGKCDPLRSILRAAENQPSCLLLTDKSVSLSHSVLLSWAARARRERARCCPQASRCRGPTLKNDGRTCGAEA